MKEGVRMKKFEEIIAVQKELIASRSRSYNLIGNLRALMIVFVLFAVFMFVDYQKGIIYGVGALVGLGLFIVLVRRHSKIKEELNYAKSLIAINTKYIDRMKGEWTKFDDSGEEYLEESHPYALDLDIVGKQSLFQMINTTGTWYGRKELIKCLLNPLDSKEEIVERQLAIKELGNKLSLCQQMEYASHKKKTNGAISSEFLAYCNGQKEMTIKAFGWTKVLPYITITVLLAAFIFKSPVLGILGIISTLLQNIPHFLYFGQIYELLNISWEIEYFLANYVEILEVLEHENFNTKKLKHLKSILFEQQDCAVKGIKELEHICSKAHLIRHPLLALPLDILLLWDYQCAAQFEAWKDDYGIKLQQWFEAIGEMEALMSLSVLLHIDEEMKFPILEDSGVILHGNDIGHPLINKHERITNNIDMDNQIWVITGSNMSGKTTFLRTIGINLVLASCGAPVCAKSLNCSKMNIYTSMRIRDDLKEGLSTFYAELMRIKQIIDATHKQGEMIFLIDEIFRGTNSIDRIEGARSVLMSLNREGIIGAITTHDLELCMLAEKERIDNYHFTEDYKEDKILFDYKLKEGPSTSTNAKYLMKLVGIEI